MCISIPGSQNDTVWIQHVTLSVIYELTSTINTLPRTCLPDTRQESDERWIASGQANIRMIWYRNVSWYFIWDVYITIFAARWRHDMKRFPHYWPYVRENHRWRLHPMLSQFKAKNSLTNSPGRTRERAWDGSWIWDIWHHRPLARYVKLRVAHASGMRGAFSPATAV